MKQVDPRIGLYEHYDPKVCAVTGQLVMGRHHSTLRIKDNYHCCILSKVKLSYEDTQKLKDELLNLIPKVAKKQEVKQNDKQS